MTSDRLRDGIGAALPEDVPAAPVEIARCVMCRHPKEAHGIDPETGHRPCRNVGHPKGLNCTECERLTSPEHIAALTEFRFDGDPVMTDAFGAYLVTLYHVRCEFGDAADAFFTDVHQSALASALVEVIPAIKAQIRAKVAEEIKAARGPDARFAEGWASTQDRDHAAAIALGDVR